jgi:hypothetical protein
MKTIAQTCLKRPAKKGFFSVQHHHVKLFRGDQALAKVLGAIDVFSAWKLSDQEVAADSNDQKAGWGPWITASIKKIADHLANTIGRTTIIDRLKVLEFLGIIEKTQAIGKESQYRLNIAALDCWSATEYVIPEEYLTRTNSERNTRPELLPSLFDPGRVPVQKNTGKQSEVESVNDVYIGSNNKTNTLEYFSYPSHPAAESFLDVVGNTKSDNELLSNPNPQPPSPTTADTGTRASRSSRTSARQHSGLDAPTAFAIWNETLPHKEFPWSTLNSAKPPALSDPDLTLDKWREVVEKCRHIIDADPVKNSWLTPLFALGAKDGVLTWTRILGGAYDFLITHDKRAVTKSVTDEFIEEMRKQIEEAA